MVTQAFESFSQCSGAKSLSNQDNNKFVFYQSSNKQIKSNDFKEIFAKDSKINYSQVNPFDAESLPDVIKLETKEAQILDDIQLKGFSENLTNNAYQKKIGYLICRIDGVADQESLYVKKLNEGVV